MPTFNFNITTSNKKNTKKSNNTKGKIIEKDVSGIIFIDIDANYYVLYNNTRYSIKKECYSCEGVKSIYKRIDVDYKHTKYIRTSDKCDECDNLYWIPFHEGCIATGDIIFNNLIGIEEFNIKSIILDYNNPIACKARDFYKDNFETINKVIINKRDETR